MAENTDLISEIISYEEWKMQEQKKFEEKYAIYLASVHKVLHGSKSKNDLIYKAGVQQLLNGSKDTRQMYSGTDREERK